MREYYVNTNFVEYLRNTGSRYHACAKDFVRKYNVATGTALILEYMVAGVNILPFLARYGIRVYYVNLAQLDPFARALIRLLNLKFTINNYFDMLHVLSADALYRDFVTNDKKLVNRIKSLRPHIIRIKPVYLKDICKRWGYI